MLVAGKRILKQLNDSGYEAYFVGGFVRDQLLGISSSDIDITTNATPDEIEKIFNRTIPTGKKYGTVTVMIDSFSFEVTTYRMDKAYVNHRHPEAVVYTKSLKNDLIRRDFTMNALVQDVNGEIIDLFDGKSDIFNGVIRAIDNPFRRFKEDALRILRAIRFAGKLHFSIESNTLQAMKQDVGLLAKIPSERVISELKRILKQPYHKDVYQLLDHIGFGDVFQELDQAIHLLKDTDEEISLESFFALGTYPQTQFESQTWRLSNKQVWMIDELLHLMSILERQEVTPLIAFQHDKYMIEMANTLVTRFYHAVSQKEMIDQVYRTLPIKTKKELAINGKLIEPMVKSKRHVGYIIQALIEAVLYKRIKNQKDDLLLFARNLAEALNESN